MDPSNDSPNRRSYVCSNCNESFKDPETLEAHKADTHICFKFPPPTVTLARIKSLSVTSQREIEVLTNEATTTRLRLLVQLLKSLMVSKFSAFQAYLKENEELHQVAYCLRETVLHKNETSKKYEEIPSVEEALEKTLGEQIGIFERKYQAVYEMRLAVRGERNKMFEIGEILGKQRAANEAAVKATDEEKEAFVLLDDEVKGSEQRPKNKSLLVPKSFTNSMSRIQLHFGLGNDLLKELKAQAASQQTSLSAVQAALTREQILESSTSCTAENMLRCLLNFSK